MEGLLLLLFFCVPVIAYYTWKELKTPDKSVVPYRAIVPSAIVTSRNNKFGNLRILASGDFQLNPEGSQPLTLYSVPPKTVSLIQAFFWNMDRSPEDSLRNLFMTQFIGVREFDTPGQIKDCLPLYALSNKYSVELMDMYFDGLSRGYVLKIDHKDQRRPLYETMVKSGLALYGEDIPFYILTASLGRDRLYEIGKQFNMKGKRKTIDTATHLCENPEVRGYIKAIIPYNQCFLVQKTPETESATECYRYVAERAERFYKAYLPDFSRYRTIIRAEEALEYKAIEGLQYKCYCDDLDCKLKDGKVYSIEEAKRLKFKPECRCDLLPYNSEWASI